MWKLQTGTVTQKRPGAETATKREKREFVHFLIHESNISQASKQYLEDSEKWIPKYQLRGLKYGLVTSALTFTLFPVIRR